MRDFHVKKFFLSSCVAMMFISMFAQFFSVPLMYKVLVASTPILISIHKPILHCRPAFYLVIFISAFFCVASIPSFLYQERDLWISIFLLCAFVYNITMAYIVSNEKISNFIASAPFIIFIFLSFFLIITGASPRYFFPQSSTNSFSWLAVFGASIWYIVQYRQKNDFKPSFWPAASALVISLWSVSRSGIASTAILLFGVVVIRFFQSSRKIIFIIFLVFISSITLSTLLSVSPSVSFNVFDKFLISGANDQSRSILNSNYIQKIDSIEKLFCGVDIRNDWYASKYAFNLHNSFLYFHSISGIASLVIVPLLLLGIIRSGFNHPMLWFTGIALFFRISTDTGALIGSIDPALFCFLFLGKRLH